MNLRVQKNKLFQFICKYTEGFCSIIHLVRHRPGQVPEGKTKMFYSDNVFTDMNC